MKEKKIDKNIKMRMIDSVYYIWVGGSCDYAHDERAGAAAYIIEKANTEVDHYVIADFHTTEFRMMLHVMIHALNVLPVKSDIVFLTNVAYLQNFDKMPTETSANSDLILQCIDLKERHASCKVKTVPYHKYIQLQQTHDTAHREMIKLRTNINK